MEHGQCSLCNEKGHTAASCPDLCSPLKEGFQGGGSGGSHSHDEEESTEISEYLLFEYVQDLHVE
jgi:hypothetical protein